MKRPYVVAVVVAVFMFLAYLEVGEVRGGGTAQEASASDRSRVTASLTHVLTLKWY
jgi:hypothetical protein